jgi:hypothetical protein
MYILAAVSPSIQAHQRFTLLILAAFVEGALGGFPALQVTTTAYISDCTSDGSRANIFSRFHGVFFVGIALGPGIGALILRQFAQNITSNFIASAMLLAVNLLCCLFVFPESLSNDRREEFRQKRTSLAESSRIAAWWLPFYNIVSPLAIFLPRKRVNRKGLDWNFTLLAMAVFCSVLTIVSFPLAVQLTSNKRRACIPPNTFMRPTSILGTLKAYPTTLHSWALHGHSISWFSYPVRLPIWFYI